MPNYVDSLAIATGGLVVDFPAEADTKTAVEYASGSATGTFSGVSSPSIPTMSLSVIDNDLTISLSGDSGVTHYAKYRQVGKTTWTTVSRVDDGDILVSDLENGTFVITAWSDNGANSSPVTDSIVINYSPPNDVPYSGNIIASITNGVFRYDELSNLINAGITPGITNGVFLFDGIIPSDSVVLLHSPARIIANYIWENAIANMTDPSDSADLPLYINRMPDGNNKNIPDNCGCVYDTTGIKDLRLMQGEIAENYGIQITMRNRDADDGWALLNTIALALDSINKEEISISNSTYKLVNLSRQSPVTSIGKETGSKTRYLSTVNFLCTIRRIIYS